MQIRRPSLALVLSLVALFVALGGTGYAAMKLPRNSVGAAQLRNGAVTPSKLSAGAIRSLRGAAAGARGAKRGRPPRPAGLAIRSRPSHGRSPRSKPSRGGRCSSVAGAGWR